MLTQVLPIGMKLLLTHLNVLGLLLDRMNVTTVFLTVHNIIVCLMLRPELCLRLLLFSRLLGMFLVEDQFICSSMAQHPQD
jgi:hypothetical protein